MKAVARLGASLACSLLGFGCTTPEETAIRFLQADPSGQYQQLASAVRAKVSLEDYIERGGEVDSFSTDDTVTCPLVREEGAHTLVACISERPRPDASGGGRVRKRGYVYLTKGILGYRLLSSSVPYQSAWAEYQEGVASESQEHLLAAARILDGILAEYPTDPRALALKLRTRVELGDLDAATFVGTEAKIRSQALLADAAIIDMLRSCGRQDGFDCPHVYAEQALDSPEAETLMLAALTFFNAEDDDRTLSALRSVLPMAENAETNGWIVVNMLRGILARDATKAVNWMASSEEALTGFKAALDVGDSCQIAAMMAFGESIGALSSESRAAPDRLRAASEPWSAFESGVAQECGDEVRLSRDDCAIAIGDGAFTLGVDFMPEGQSTPMPVCPMRVEETKALAWDLDVAEQVKSFVENDSIDQAEDALSFISDGSRLRAGLERTIEERRVVLSARTGKADAVRALVRELLENQAAGARLGQMGRSLYAVETYAKRHIELMGKEIPAATAEYRTLYGENALTELRDSMIAPVSRDFGDEAAMKLYDIFEWRDDPEYWVAKQNENLGGVLKADLIEDVSALLPSLCVPPRDQRRTAGCYRSDWQPWVKAEEQKLLASMPPGLTKDIGTEAPAQVGIRLPDATPRVVFQACRAHACATAGAAFVVDPQARELDVVWFNESGVRYFGPNAQRIFRGEVAELLDLPNN